jgi:hypothetical protein
MKVNVVLEDRTFVGIEGDSIQKIKQYVADRWNLSNYSISKMRIESYNNKIV